MEILVPPPHFDGKKWKCACGAVVAILVEHTHTHFDSAARAFVQHTEPALELPADYVHLEGRDVWLKPQSVLPPGRGTGQRARRKDVRDFRGGQLERASRKNDVASIVEANWQLRAQDEKLRAPSVPAVSSRAARAGTPATRFISSQLPIRVECPNLQCKRVWRLIRIKGATTRPVTAQGRAA